MGRTRFLCATKHEYTFRKSVTKSCDWFCDFAPLFLKVVLLLLAAIFYKRKSVFNIVVAVSSRVFFAPLFPKVEYQERASIPWLQPCKGCALPSELSRQIHFFQLRKKSVTKPPIDFAPLFISFAEKVVIAPWAVSLPRENFAPLFYNFVKKWKRVPNRGRTYGLSFNRRTLYLLSYRNINTFHNFLEKRIKTSTARSFCSTFLKVEISMMGLEPVLQEWKSYVLTAYTTTKPNCS